MVRIKGLRRSIIVVCIVLLALSGVIQMPPDKYYYAYVKNLVNQHQAEVVEVGKSLKLDDDRLVIDRVIISKDKLYLRYTLKRKLMGWSFCDNSIKIYDDKNKELQIHSGGQSGRAWGEYGIIEYSGVKGDIKYITVKLNHYDRRDEMKILLKKEGDQHENK